MSSHDQSIESQKGKFNLFNKNAGNSVVNNKEGGEDPYDEKSTASAGHGSDPIPVQAADSIFNPFNAFRFHKFGPSGDDYKRKLHQDKELFGGMSNSNNVDGGKGFFGGIKQNVLEIGANLLSYYGVDGGPNDTQLGGWDASNSQQAMQNPNIHQILEWSQETAVSDGTFAPSPYQANDFLWCKYYGKVPNNRMVTLRRYPWPVEDDMRLLGGAGRDIPIPLAQAVTWFGEEIQNPLKNILNISWDLKWDSKIATVQDIEGNEILVDDVLDGLGIQDKFTRNTLRAGVATAQGGDLSTLELANYDGKMLKWIKDSYKDNGPYWNRVLGPVNVVDRSTIRQRGMGLNMFGSEIKLNFQYSLRSYMGVNPKIAFLDLLSNFLTLTYNTANFWGGGYRYFPRAGLKINSAGSDMIEKGHVVAGIQKTLEDWMANSTLAMKQIMQDLQGNFSDILSQGGTIGTAATADGAGGTAGTQAFNLTPGKSGVNLVDENDVLTTTGQKIADNILATRASALMRQPLMFRSLLEDKPIGEWHITIGNPMNPMAMMGNLYVKSVKMETSEVLGADDFPSEITFVVSLGHGKPRAKQSVESIFNMGNGALSFNTLKQPSSAEDTLGGKNFIPPMNSINATDANSAADSKSGNLAGANKALNLGVNEIGLKELDSSGYEYDDVGYQLYSKKVGKAYGEKFGTDNALLKQYIEYAKD